METDDQVAQTDEVTALASIYEERIFLADGNNGGHFSAYLDLPEEFFIELHEASLVHRTRKLGCRLEEGHEGSSLLRINHLPPIVLNFKYPEDYPSRSAPTFTLSCKWLNVDKLSELRSHLDRIWDEHRGEVIIFQWTQFLIDDSLWVLRIQSSLSLGSAAVQLAQGDSTELADTSGPHSVKNKSVRGAGQLLQTLIDYDISERRRVFDESIHSCSVCFSEKAGVDCVMFQSCNHVYCKDCVRDYFMVQIKAGNVKALNCPDTECDSVAMPPQVYALVGEELFATYDRLLLQRTLEGMDDIVYCPRLSCQCPVMKDGESSLAVCSACGYSFCVLCNRVYHGVSPCVASEEEILKVLVEFEDGDEDCKVRLEKRYGKDLFKDLREEAEERRRQEELAELGRLKEAEERRKERELAEKEPLKQRMQNQRWKNNNTKQCPTCGTHIEKNQGCNMMKCTHCNKSFCWRCLQVLPHTYSCDSVFDYLQQAKTANEESTTGILASS
ncbi:E3 ubiquitin-protein ligase RNF14-like [Acanthaster planci]|uniref:RBR-type E3 ubiquitin transferase n=1 Tax=Acanthaster planci TaxID=133434 RepID=A0A8B7Z6U4_ACAPL|nr:E3 ubiquitin-protein ligase RNF14-like [Acanthaster planci]